MRTQIPLWRRWSFARPVSDFNAHSWTTTPLFSKIDEVDADDADEISSEVLVAPGTTTIADLLLDVLTDPIINTDHVARVRAKATFTLGSAAKLRMSLMYSGIIFAQVDLNLTSSYQTFEFAVSTAGAGLITNYAALEVQFSGVFATGNIGSVQVSWFEFAIPERSGIQTQSAAADLVGVGAVTAAAVRTAEVASSLAGVGVLTGAVTRTAEVASSLIGVGVLTGVAIRSGEVASALVGVGVLTAAATRSAEVTAALIGIGVLTADATSTTVQPVAPPPPSPPGGYQNFEPGHEERAYWEAEGRRLAMLRDDDDLLLLIGGNP